MRSALLPEVMIPRAAQRFKVLSEPVRLELLDVIFRNRELSVQELVDATGHRQANVSKHLNLMAREGLLHRRKQGLHVYYSIEDPTLQSLCVLISDRLVEESQAQHHRLSKPYVSDMAA